MAMGYSDTPRKGKTQQTPALEWRLRDKETKRPIEVGDVCYTFRGEAGIVTAMRPPHKPSSSGHVSVRIDGFGWTQEFYPSVIGAEYYR